jgi:hypothetical protein
MFHHCVALAGCLVIPTSLYGLVCITSVVWFEFQFQSFFLYSNQVI